MSTPVAGATLRVGGGGHEFDAVLNGNPSFERIVLAAAEAFVESGRSESAAAASDIWSALAIAVSGDS
jgi:hypothetical protein